VTSAGKAPLREPELPEGGASEAATLQGPLPKSTTLERRCPGRPCSVSRSEVTARVLWSYGSAARDDGRGVVRGDARHARPPTADDVTILWDGRRLDSREAVMEWLAEVEAKRAEEAAAGADAGT
jgi:hypothetical protein